MSGENRSGDRAGPEATARTGSSVTRNTFWNLLGTGLPILLALVTVPILIDAIGIQRFGVIVLAWVVLGYFGLFDLGLGRATTKFLAEAFDQGRLLEARALFWTSLLLNLILGIVGTIVLLVLIPALVNDVLNIPAELRGETRIAFYLLALGIPLVTTTAGLRGTLEARHRFGLLNVLQVPTSALVQVAPLLALPFTGKLPWLIGSIVLSRLVGAVVFLIVAVRQFERPMQGPFFLHGWLRPLFTYGGWLTVSNVVGPLMVYVDRFVIGALTSLTAVTYYATPYEAVTRLWILPQSLTRTLFPTFSVDLDLRQINKLYNNALYTLSLLLAPLVTSIIVFAPELLSLWVGDRFEQNSTTVLQLLAMGVFANSLALVPFTLIQGIGRPDVTAKFHLLELPFYLVMLWYGVHYAGIVGAATAWTLRTISDALLLEIYVRKSGAVTNSPRDYTLLQTLGLTSGLTLAAWILYLLAPSLVTKASLWSITVIVTAYAAWRFLLDSRQRKKLIRYAKRGYTSRRRSSREKDKDSI